MRAIAAMPSKTTPNGRSSIEPSPPAMKIANVAGQ
jgi:hypothetical protein